MKQIRFGCLCALLVILAGCQTLPPSQSIDEIAPSSYGSFLAARYAGARRDVSASAELYEKALEQEPGFGLLSQRIFLLALLAGDFDRADRHVEFAASNGDIATFALAYLRATNLAGRSLKAPAQLPDNTDQFSAMVVAVLNDWTRVAAGDVQEVRAGLMLQGAAGTSKGYLMIHEALIMERASDYEAAEQAYRAAYTTLSMTDFTTLLLGAFLERRKRVDEARLLYQTRSDNTQNLDPNLKAALERVSKSGSKAPSFPSARHAAARAIFVPSVILTNQAPLDYAVQYLRMIQRLDPDFGLNTMTLASILDELEMVDLAIDAYDSISTGPYAQNFEVQSLWLKYREDPSDQIKMRARQLANSDNTLDNIRFMLADMLRVSGDCEAALEIYGAIISDRRSKMKDADWRHAFSAGLCVHDVHDWPRAERYFLRALDLAPSEPIILNHLGYLWVVRGEKIEEGFELIRRAIDLAPNNGNIIDSLGWGYFKQNQYAQAVSWLEQAVEREPSNGTINWHLGDAYAAVGRDLEAQFQWRRALQLDVDEDEINLINRRLELGLDAGPVDVE